MGRVYFAHDPDLNREVALKVIAQKAAASGSLLCRDDKEIAGVWTAMEELGVSTVRCF